VITRLLILFTVYLNVSFDFQNKQRSFFLYTITRFTFVMDSVSVYRVGRLLDASNSTIVQLNLNDRI